MEDVHEEPLFVQRVAVYRFRTRRNCCDLRFGRMSKLGQDRGLCLFASFI